MNAKLKNKCVYRMRGQKSYVECLGRRVDKYSDYTYCLRNIESKWRFIAHGVIIYDDGSIEWDFSTDGYFDDKGGF